MKILSEEEIKEILEGIFPDNQTTSDSRPMRNKLSHLNHEFANFVTNQKIKHKIRVARVNGADHVKLTDRETDVMLQKAINHASTAHEREM